MKEIGEFLKQKRLEKGITIDQIAEKNECKNEQHRHYFPSSSR